MLERRWGEIKRIGASWSELGHRQPLGYRPFNALRHIEFLIHVPPESEWSPVCPAGPVAGVVAGVLDVVVVHVAVVFVMLVVSIVVVVFVVVAVVAVVVVFIVGAGAVGSGAVCQRRPC